MKLQPLQQFICDSCGEIIQFVEHGWVEWLNKNDEDNTTYGFRIVHKTIHSPLKDKGIGCIYDEQYEYRQDHSLVADTHLDRFVGPDGLAYILAFFKDRKLTDPQELIELIRRLHIPYYEEARIYWDRASNDGFFDGMHEFNSYMQEYLLEIIDRYRE